MFSKIQTAFYQFLKQDLLSDKLPTLWEWDLLARRFKGSAVPMCDIDEKSNDGVICTLAVMDYAEQALH